VFTLTATRLGDGKCRHGRPRATSRRGGSAESRPSGPHPWNAARLRSGIAPGRGSSGDGSVSKSRYLAPGSPVFWHRETRKFCAPIVNSSQGSVAPRDIERWSDARRREPERAERAARIVRAWPRALDPPNAGLLPIWPHLTRDVGRTVRPGDSYRTCISSAAYDALRPEPTLCNSVQK